MKRILLLNFLFCFSLVGQVLAQDRTVTGKVISAEDGMTLPGVSVVIKGTSKGTTTDLNGNYSISVPSNGGVLTFNFIGLVTQELEIGARSVIDVSMLNDVKQLNEVLVVAYGTADKNSFTGSVGTIKADALAPRPVTNLNNAIAGAMPGVQVNAGSGQPGDGPAIRIRGIGSVNASSAPLYVVDGVPYTGAISSLNMDDVENITVLKDAASAAIYGSRAANGVIMITTKKGNKDRNQINLKVNQGFTSRAIPEYDRLDAFQFYPLNWESYRNGFAYNGNNPLSLEAASIKASQDIFGQLRYNPFNVPNGEIVLPDGTINPNAQLLYGNDLDWEAPLMRVGKRNEYNLSTSGGGAKSDYFVSLGYLDEKGYVINSDFQRFNGRVNINAKPKDWFKTGLNLSGNVSLSNQANDGSSTGFVNPFFFSRNMGPIYPVHAHDPSTGQPLLDSNGKMIYDLGNMTELGLQNRPSMGGRHIVAETLWNVNDLRRNVLGARTYGEVTFLKDFKFTANIGLDINNFSGRSYTNNIVGDGAPAGRASKTVSTTTGLTLNQLLTYSKTLGGKHNIDFLAGHESYDWTYEYFYGFRQGQVVEGNIELGNFTTVNSLTSRTDKYRTEGYFTRANYNYDDRYSLSASFRRDGSSMFHTSVRFGNFWSLGGAWRLDNEKFLALPDWVNLLKIRGSYGQVGNDNLSGYYPYQALYASGPSINNGAEPGFRQSSLATPELVWESNDTYDIALDFGLLKNRITGSVEFFHRQSTNLLFEVPLPPSSGLRSYNANVGTMFNRGLEVQLAADVLKRGGFNWNVNFNLTTFKNEITKLPEGQDEIITGTKKLMVGHSIYDYWLRSYYGVDPTDGAALYYADNLEAAGNRTIGEDILTTSANNAKFNYHGSAIPAYIGGMTNTFSYRNLSLSILLTYQKGGLVYDATYASLMTSTVNGSAMHIDILNRWQKPGDVTNVPRVDNVQSAQFNAASDRWLTDGSHINIRSANLSYILPKPALSRIGVSRANVFVSGENLALFSHRKGMNVAQSFTGVTSNSYSPSRIISLGLNVTL
jgi:TonB-linked SusC/RagA family outer membrane protein